ncbi:hypothetical protein EBN03_20775 [Nocardia stercoris]|uniref:Uncharacterized protein n=1 Tax=Nocardia stercoris TaxID=2483361 RepID=A0A3M2L1B2_9NOCA|nr:hypothetical protein EBN03_20775 [Nocardia stercoris]
MQAAGRFTNSPDAFSASRFDRIRSIGQGDDLTQVADRTGPHTRDTYLAANRTTIAAIVLWLR